MAKKKATEQPPAPPPARRRRGLAGRFDLLVAWATRVAKGKDLTTKDKAIVGPLLVLGLAYYARGALAARSNLPVLNASDADTLKSVFFSGDPWLVECTSAKRSSALVDSSARLSLSFVPKLRLRRHPRLCRLAAPAPASAPGACVSWAVAP